MAKAPDLRIYDTRIPYYDRTPHRRALRATLVKFVDGIGTHLICPRAACRREGGCADGDMRALPFCWEHYRGMLRFILNVAEKRLGIDGRGPPPDPEPALPEPFEGQPLLARWAAEGVDIGVLARPAEAGRDETDWECTPGMPELFRELIAAGPLAPAPEDGPNRNPSPSSC